MMKYPPEWDGKAWASIVVELLDGAEFEYEPGVALTPSQMWGRLLRMSREEREKWFIMHIRPPEEIDE